MVERLVALIVDEGKWLTASMGLALPCTSVLLHRHRPSDLRARHRVAAAMNLFFIASLVFLASGQSFEQFSGID